MTQSVQHETNQWCGTHAEGWVMLGNILTLHIILLTSLLPWASFQDQQSVGLTAPVVIKVKRLLQQQQGLLSGVHLVSQEYPSAHEHTVKNDGGEGLSLKTI